MEMILNIREKHMSKQVFNPYLPEWEYVPDGEPKIFDDRVYIFGSHDIAGGQNYCSEDYVCWSAPINDLTSWSFEGTIYRKEDDPGYRNESGVRLYAPDLCKGKDGKFYLYYFSNKLDRISVAVCEFPAGHYTYLGDVHLKNRKVFDGNSGYGLPFDPSILCDGDDIFLYYGFAFQEKKEKFNENGYCGAFCAKLEDDMLTMKTDPVCIIPGKLYSKETEFEGHAFLEASSIRHYGDKYYFVYSSENGHELSYAISDSPDRNYRYKGTLISNGDVGLKDRKKKDAVNYLGNNHGGILKIEDNYYIFYHRHTHGIPYSRQGCAEKIQMDFNGEFSQAEVTSCGLNNGSLEAKGTYPARIACCLKSVDGVKQYSKSVHWDEKHPYIAHERIQDNATSEMQYIYNLRNGAICGYKYFHFDETERKVKICSRGRFEGILEMYIGNLEPDNLCAVIAVNHLENHKQWSWEEVMIKGKKGDYPIYFKVCGKGALDFKEFVFE